jgi:hypothetical protein
VTARGSLEEAVLACRGDTVRIREVLNEWCSRVSLYTRLTSEERGEVVDALENYVLSYTNPDGSLGRKPVRFLYDRLCEIHKRKGGIVEPISRERFFLRPGEIWSTRSVHRIGEPGSVQLGSESSPDAEEGDDTVQGEDDIQ